MNDIDRIAETAVARIAAAFGPPHTSPGRWRWEIPRAANLGPVSLAIVQTDRGVLLAQISVPDERLSAVTGVLLDSFQAIDSLRSRLVALLGPTRDTPPPLN